MEGKFSDCRDEIIGFREYLIMLVRMVEEKLNILNLVRMRNDKKNCIYVEKNWLGYGHVR